MIGSSITNGAGKRGDTRQRSQARLDLWENALTGLGTLRDKMRHFVFGKSAIDDSTFEALYADDDMAGAICESVPDDMTRQGFTIQIEHGEDEKGDENDVAKVVSDLSAKLDDLCAIEKYKEAMIEANVLGGSAIFIGADDNQEVDQPLNENNIKSVDYINVYTKKELEAVQWYDDPVGPRYREPKLFRVKTSAGLLSTERYVHESRLIIFQGVRTTWEVKKQNGGWNQSLLHRCFEPIKQYQSMWGSISNLMQDAFQATWKIKGLLDMIGSGDKDNLITRMELIDKSRSICRAVLLDADDEAFERQSISLGGVEGVLDKMMLRVSAAAQMPATRLICQSPAGLNATGESDIRWYYDRVKSKQTNEFKPKLERLIRLIFLSTLGPTRGREPDAWSIKFNPLWQMSPSEESAQRKATAETDAIYIDKGVVLPEEVALSRFKPEGFSAEWQVDLDIRKKALELEADTYTEEDRARAEGNESSAEQEGVQKNEAGADAEAATTTPNAVDPQTALNGAQVQSLQQIVSAVAARELPRATGIKIIAAAFPLNESQAEDIMGEVGITFFTKGDGNEDETKVDVPKETPPPPPSSPEEVPPEAPQTEVEEKPSSEPEA